MGGDGLAGEDLTMDDLEGSDTAGPTDDATMTADAREVALKAVASLKADAAKLRRSDGKGPAPKKQKRQPCGTPCEEGQPKKKVLSKKQQLAEILVEETATPQKEPHPSDADVSSDADVRGLHL